MRANPDNHARRTSDRGPAWNARALAALVHATRYVDRAAALFDRVRSRALLRFAPASFFEAYNDLTYARQTTYHPGATEFRADLFEWEAAAMRQFFPRPPAALLIGGAGGGREALALAAMGYRVVAFEPSRVLANSLAAVAPGRDIQALAGRYRDLPVVTSAGDSVTPVDLRTAGPFDAAIFGWSSFSHLRTPDERRTALVRMRELSRGPILLSYFSSANRGRSAANAWFSIDVGYAQELTQDDIRACAADAGLRVLHLEHGGTWPHAILTRET